MRVVLDTDVLLAGLACPGSIPGKIIAAWRHGSVEVVLSTFILDELRRVLPRLVGRHGLSNTEIDDLVDALSIQAEVLEPAPVEDSALRDRNDLPILGILLAAVDAADIDYLITADKDLLALASRYPVATPAGFWARHGSA
ncbi:MAG: putative toxin-antitoxin system toxin component, PIN family [Pseudomonadota bacterium]